MQFINVNGIGTNVYFVRRPKRESSKFTAARYLN